MRCRAGFSRRAGQPGGAMPSGATAPDQPMTLPMKLQIHPIADGIATGATPIPVNWLEAGSTEAQRAVDGAGERLQAAACPVHAFPYHGHASYQDDDPCGSR